MIAARRPVRAVVASLLATLPGLAAVAAAPAGGGDGRAGAPAIEEIVVTSERRELDSAFVPASLSALDASRIAAINAVHPHELLLRFPGVWLSRGSGQESLPAIRSPVLTGAGACGAILTLEDGIPTRPAGFCNVNQVFELNTEQAAAVEVLRGPGNVLYGSNALHGVINVLMPGPGAPGYAALEAGANDYFRVQAAGAPSPASYASLVYADDGGFRVNTGYRQAKAYATAGLKAGGGDLRVAFSASDLDQETGGYIEGEAAYEDPVLRLSNPNPDSFREAGSQRLYAIWTREDGDRRIDVRPYLRHSDMRFLQHFLPGQPLEENGQTSTGFLALVQQDDDGRRLMAGIDLDVSESWVEETQAGLAVGSPFLVATRPPGKHYDYTVTGVTAAAYAQGQWALAPSLELTAGLRAETTWYDYDNRMLDGNTRDDGVPCDFGGCLYTRPGDRSDRYSDVAPHLALDWAVRESLHAYARLARGFRPPQATELYRLQSGQDVADLDSETVDSAEIGVRARTGRWLIDGVVFAMRKEDSVLRDASGFNVSGGRSRHSGLEANVDGYLTRRLRLAAAATLARHTYDFDRVAALGETFVSGRDVDTAPRWFGSVDLYYTAFDWLELALQWTAIGEYYLDAENEHEYPGHSLVNVRATVVPAAAWEISFRLYNLADERYADRADYAFGDYRYFPGRARELFVELRWAPGG